VISVRPTAIAVAAKRAFYRIFPGCARFIRLVMGGAVLQAQESKKPSWEGFLTDLMAYPQF